MALGKLYHTFIPLPTYLPTYLSTYIPTFRVYVAGSPMALGKLYHTFSPLPSLHEADHAVQMVSAGHLHQGR